MRELGGPFALGAVAVAVVVSLAVGTASGPRNTIGGQVGELAGTLANDSAPDVFRVYLDPAGSDANDGRSPSSAVQSLAQIQRLVAAARPSSDVEVRIKQGTYVASPLEWTTFVPGRSITFLPIDYEYGEGVTGFAGRPIFRGNGSAGFWFRATLPEGSRGGDTRLRFYYLQVERYSSGGIMFDGGTVEGAGLTRARTAGMNANTVYGMNFRLLGSRHVSSGVGFGAVDLVNARNNVIQLNQFTQIENRLSSGEAELVHGVYLAHHSSGNKIRDNRFRAISGDPIRTRNSSGDNQIFRNVFIRSGYKAFFSDWFISAAKSRQTRECESRGNRFYANRLISGYRKRVEAWSASPHGGDHSSTAECGNDTQERVLTWGNTTR